MCSNLFVILFLVTPCVVEAGQPCIVWIPIKKNTTLGSTKSKIAVVKSKCWWFKFVYLMNVIACTCASTHVTGLICVNNSMYHFCSGHSFVIVIDVISNTYSQLKINRYFRTFKIPYWELSIDIKIRTSLT